MHIRVARLDLDRTGDIADREIPADRLGSDRPGDVLDLRVGASGRQAQRPGAIDGELAAAMIDRDGAGDVLDGGRAGCVGGFERRDVGDLEAIARGFHADAHA